jgi:hypothetical protein
MLHLAFRFSILTGVHAAIWRQVGLNVALRLVHERRARVNGGEEEVRVKSLGPIIVSDGMN